MIADIDRQAQERFERLIEGMKHSQGMDDTPEEENGGQEEDTSQKSAAAENAAKIPYPVENTG